MQSAQVLRNKLGGIDGKDYGACQSLKGEYAYPDFELCAADPRAVKVRAYSGRFVAPVDISGFIDNLPFKRDTTRFSTPNASGSTSQAASIVEALEMEARVLLMDEDTCASNFMIRDRKMQELVGKEGEPITPYIERVRQLHEQEGVSSVVVLGGVGDYFEVADTVIQMVRYEPFDVTAANRLRTVLIIQR